MGNTSPAVICEARPASRGALIRKHGRLPVGACMGRWGASQSQGSRKGTTGPHRYNKQGRLGCLGLPHSFCCSWGDLGQLPSSTSMPLSPGPHMERLS